MILVNRNFGNPVLASAIGDMFRGSSDVDQKVDWVPNTGVLAANSSLVSGLTNRVYQSVVIGSGSGTNEARAAALNKANTFLASLNTYNIACNNFHIVTEHFLNTLDKVYTKIWNESFNEIGIYTPSNLATIFHGFVTDISTRENGPFMMFKKFVDRCISAGILDEADRLDYQDLIFISGMSRVNMSTQVDLANKLITMTHSSPIDIAPDINAITGQYLAGKKLFLMMTPYQINESVIKGQTETSGTLVTQEPFWNTQGALYDIGGSVPVWSDVINKSVRRPIAFFKPKTDASKFGRSLPLATHLIWSIGTPEDKELALLEGKPVPDLIFDHLDRISHIDSLTLKIKFDKLSF